MTPEFEVLPEEVPAESVTTDSEESQVAQPVYDGPSPGELLRAAREEKDLSLDDIVMQSRMSMETVKALEEDRDPPQNAWVYVRGYYRKYARVLGIPEEELLHAHERYVGGAPAPQPVSAEWAPQDVSPGGGVPKIVLVLVAGILFGGVLWWGMPIFMGSSDSGKTEPVKTSTRTGLSDSVASAPVVVKKMPTVQLDETAGDMSPESEAGGSVGTMSEAEAADEASSVESNPAEVTNEEEEVDAPQNVHEDVAAATGPKLGFEFTDRSWVNVVDANGKKLLDGIVKAGVQLSVTGQPPFKVFLGYAPGVQISYEGRMIDTAPHTSSNNTARFTVGAEEAPAP